MTEMDRVFTDSVAALYESHLVPLIFADPALDMADRVARAGVRNALEIAAGTGVVTRALAPRLAPDARLTVTDLNAAMLEEARRRQPGDRRIGWQVADALALPFGDEAFDAVYCQFGAMFFPDRVRAFSEARRVLRPGGRLVFSVWDRIEENLFAHLVTEAVAALFPQEPPRFLARTPHGHHDSARLEAELRTAGFAEIEIAAWQGTSRADGPDRPAVAYCQGTPLRGEIEALGPGALEAATGAATAAIAARCGPGPVEGPIRSFVLSACASAPP